jgi:hypothetical protein
MTKKQVIALSSLLCAVGLVLGIVLVMSAFGNAGNYSLAAWIVFTVLGVSCLGMVAAPGLLFAWYPAEGFSGEGAVTESDSSNDALNTETGDSESDDDDFDDDDFDDESGHDDDGEQLFEEDVMDHDDFEDDFGNFDDEG